MQDVQYIFDSWEHEFHSMLRIAGVLLLVGILLIVLPAFGNDKRQLRRRESRKVAGYFSLFLFFLWGGIAGCEYLERKQIMRHYATVPGRLIVKKYHRGKSSGWYYEYTYDVGLGFYRNDNVYAPDDTVINAAKQDSCYMVIYDTNNPSNAIMNLRVKRSCY